MRNTHEQLRHSREQNEVQLRVNSRKLRFFFMEEKFIRATYMYTSKNETCYKIRKRLSKRVSSSVHETAVHYTSLQSLHLAVLQCIAIQYMKMNSSLNFFSYLSFPLMNAIELVFEPHRCKKSRCH